jgi:surfactin synthase thioesterase subunit
MTASIFAVRGGPLRTLWWTLFNPNGTLPLRIVCFPYAGGHAAIFKSWTPHLASVAEVYGIQLPGRGQRYGEPPAADLANLVPSIARALRPILDRPFVLFGHSLGATLAFEVARWLRAHDRISPEHLIVSGRRAPTRPWMEPAKSTMSDDELARSLAELNGTPPELLRNSEVLAMVLPTLRADFKLVETYRYVPAAPIECPITAFGGTDDSESDDDSLDDWALQTRRGFTKRMFPGDHFFIHSRETEVLTGVRAVLERHR